jgi:hypothetical protein
MPNPKDMPGRILLYAEKAKQKKLPRGARTIGEAAQMRGRGGSIIRDLRGGDVPLETAPSPRGERVEARIVKGEKAVSSSEYRRAIAQESIRETKSSQELSRPPKPMSAKQRKRVKGKLKKRKVTPKPRPYRGMGEQEPRGSFKKLPKPKPGGLQGLATRLGRLGRGLGKLSAAGLVFEAARMSEEMKKAKKQRQTGRIEM